MNSDRPRTEPNPLEFANRLQDAIKRATNGQTVSYAEVEPTFEIGDIALPTQPSQLHCGSGVYDHAVVVSVSPFILTSDTGDMLWPNMNPSDLTRGGKAPSRELKHGLNRLAQDRKYYPSLHPTTQPGINTPSSEPSAIGKSKTPAFDVLYECAERASDPQILRSALVELARKFGWRPKPDMKYAPPLASPEPAKSEPPASEVWTDARILAMKWRHIDKIDRENSRLKSAINAYGNNPNGFDWAVLAKMDEQDDAIAKHAEEVAELRRQLADAKLRAGELPEAVRDLGEHCAEGWNRVEELEAKYPQELNRMDAELTCVRNELAAAGIPHAEGGRALSESARVYELARRLKSVTNDVKAQPPEPIAASVAPVVRVFHSTGYGVGIVIGDEIMWSGGQKAHERYLHEFTKEHSQWAETCVDVLRPINERIASEAKLAADYEQLSADFQDLHRRYVAIGNRQDAELEGLRRMKAEAERILKLDPTLVFVCSAIRQILAAAQAKGAT